jgi:hypothetical protein
MSGPYDSDDQNGQRPYRPADQPAEQPAAPGGENPASDAPGGEDLTIDRRALEQALQETLHAASSGAEIDPGEMEAIRQVARRQKGNEITLDIAADLIQAVLATHFRTLQASDSFWQTLSRDIARVLWEDPQTEARLNLLWQRLRKEAT